MMKQDFSRHIEKKIGRMLRGRRRKEHPIAFGLTMMGTVGWTVVIPVLIGAWIGQVLDDRWSQSFSWTLTLMTAGLFVGAYTAWRWGKKALEENNDWEDDHEHRG